MTGRSHDDGAAPPDGGTAPSVPARGPRGGGAGNRTRVLRRFTRASPCAVRCASTRIHRSRGRAGVTIPATVWCPARLRGRAVAVSSLNDAGTRSGNASGPTAPYWIRQRARARPEPGQCDCCRHLFGYDAWLTRSSSSSSARFTSINDRSRNRSPPGRDQSGHPCPGGRHSVTPRARRIIPVRSGVARTGPQTPSSADGVSCSTARRKPSPSRSSAAAQPWIAASCST